MDISGNLERDIKTEDIMREIRKKIKKKKEEQSRKDEPPLESIDKHQHIFGAFPEVQTLMDNIAALSLESDPRIGNKPATHRDNFIGKVIVFIKNGLLKLFQLYGNALLDKQSHINHKIAANILHLATITETTLKTIMTSFKTIVDTFTKRLDAFHQENITFKRKIENLLEDLGSEQPINSTKKIINKNLEKIKDNYLSFEDIYRGTREEIKKRQAIYLSFFKDCKDVLDVGCGRGEFLELLREEKITARGIDINEDMIYAAAQYNLDAEQADANQYLYTLEDNSIGGIFGSQFIEHLSPAYIKRFVESAYRKLRPDAPIVLETINPLTLNGIINFQLDMSHVRPIHPLSIRFILESAGFDNIRVIYLSPIKEEDKLQMIPLPSSKSLQNNELASMVTVFNRNMDKINSLLYGFQDYAIAGRKAV